MLSDEVGQFLNLARRFADDLDVADVGILIALIVLEGSEIGDVLKVARSRLG